MQLMHGRVWPVHEQTSSRLDDAAQSLVHDGWTHFASLRESRAQLAVGLSRRAAANAAGVARLD